ncbi:hypothetical protein DFP74_2222 [Nocardiopsis sp. Huas11]|uniref:hypothetical protein n=1 Tax=Nocardiopsis sp. Huas11 TaxID=2183912 RepID=UPI000EB54BEA|nr:hypothetical protein [Nocardiopsis sp. Huas11]RKS06584.1 hypothetical protein DFP74_2222 [Nocardiopsis sp. Huas11]
MEHVLLSVHVLAAIVFVGGSAVASSLFPRYAPVAAAPASPDRTAVPASPDPDPDPDPHAGTAPTPHAGTAVPDTGADPALPTDTAPATDSAGERNRAVAVSMHRITRGYALFGLVVPVAGIALAIMQGRMGEIWINVSMALTLIAGLLLATQIYPRQREALRRPGGSRPLRTLSMLAGIYNLVWATVVVLMIVRPGSEAGA